MRHNALRLALMIAWRWLHKAWWWNKEIYFQARAHSWKRPFSRLSFVSITRVGELHYLPMIGTVGKTTTLYSQGDLNTHRGYLLAGRRCHSMAYSPWRMRAQRGMEINNSDAILFSNVSTDNAEILYVCPTTPSNMEANDSKRRSRISDCMGTTWIQEQDHYICRR
jgi:hypothetical protein